MSRRRSVSASVVMVDDLGKLPEDDDLEPKRKGLRRLRKADRAFQKQEQQNQAADAKPPAAAAGGERRKSASRVAPPPVSAVAQDKGDEELAPSRHGRGRFWARRSWKATGLTDLSRVLLAAGETAAASAAAVAAGVEGDAAITVDFNKILQGVDSGVVAASKDTDEAAVAAAPAGKNGGNGAPATAQARKGSKKEKKGPGKGKGAATAAAGAGDEEEGEEAVAKRQKESREADVKGWAKALRAALEEETFVTTAHRAAVATRDAMFTKLADRTKVGLYEYSMTIVWVREE